MTFGINLSFGLWVGDDAHDQHRRNNINADRAQQIMASRQRGTTRSSCGNPTEHSRGHGERKRELQADRESLQHLEAAFASNLETAARPLENQSFAVPERATERSEGDELQRQWSTDTPPSAWRYPIIHQLRGIGSDAGRWGSLSPSSRSPASSRSASAEPATGPNFRGRQRKEPIAKLAAVGCSADSIGAISKVNEEHDRRRSEVDSVYKWFERLETKDGGEDWEGLRDNFSGSVGSTPRLSPEAEDGEVAGIRDRRMERQGMRMDGSGGAKDAHPSGSKTEKPKERKDSDGSFFDDKSWLNQLSDDEEWVNVHYFSDES